MESRVVAVDVGSVRGNFAWAALDLPGRRPVGAGGSDPEGTATVVLEALSNDIPVALGFEAPLMVPVSPVGPTGGWTSLGRARQGEVVDGRASSWSGGAGSAAMATGLVQLAWVLERLASKIPELTCTTRPEPWLKGNAQLLVWEAFVSGADRPLPDRITPHAADAAAAALTFADRLENRSLSTSDVVCTPASSFNLAAAAAMYAGLSIPAAELRSQVHVYRPGPDPKQQ